MNMHQPGNDGMRHRHQAGGTHTAQTGISLIEVMVSVFVLAVGVLGVIALQAAALKNNQGSMERSQAVIQTYSILDAMRANPANANPAANAAAYAAYALGTPCPIPSGTDMVSRDVAAWRNAIRASMGESACGAVSVAGNTVTVTMRWQEQAGRAGQAASSTPTTMAVRARL